MTRVRQRSYAALSARNVVLIHLTIGFPITNNQTIPNFVNLLIDKGYNFAQRRKLNHLSW